MGKFGSAPGATAFDEDAVPGDLGRVLAVVGRDVRELALPLVFEAMR